MFFNKPSGSIFLYSSLFGSKPKPSATLPFSLIKASIMSLSNVGPNAPSGKNVLNKSVAIPTSPDSLPPSPVVKLFNILPYHVPFSPSFSMYLPTFFL